MFGRSRAPQPEERRINPEDGRAYTLKELIKACDDEYSRAETEEYWRTHCTPVADEGKVADVSNDPFLTHSQNPPKVALPPNPRLQSAQQYQDEGKIVDTSNDPFMTHSQPAPPKMPLPPKPRSQTTPPGFEGHTATSTPADRFLTAQPQPRSVDLKDNPFLTDGPALMRERLARERVQRPPMSLQQAIGEKSRELLQAFFHMLGPGDSDRHPAARHVLMLGPWVMFLWVLIVWLVIRHHSLHASLEISLVLLLASCAMVLIWRSGKRWGPVSCLTLGALCFVATSSGILVGNIGWSQYWRQYWWLQTGHRNDGDTLPTTPATARIDAAVIDFSNNTGLGGTSVDSLKSAGYKDGHFYCAAPILDPELASASWVRVNYWAIGIDCCQSLGSFTCDDSRQRAGAYGVVMLDGGYPCPECNQDRFRKAIRKAEVMHGLVSAANAINVRWVADPAHVEIPLGLQAGLFFLLSAALSLLVSFALGGLAWYYGIGKSSAVELSGLLTGLMPDKPLKQYV